MTICHISDTHGKHNDIDFSDFIDCDVLIHSGDWTRSTRHQEAENVAFLEWLEQLDFKHKLLIAGNHELLVESNPTLFRKQLLLAPSVTYLEDSSAVLDGVKFYGSPYSNEFCGWAFMDYEPNLEFVWSCIDDDTDVLITHGPAYECHDLVSNNWSVNQHVGSTTLAARKLGLPNLQLHCSGHIHSAYGTSTTGFTNSCASICNEQYEPVNAPIKLTIKDPSL